MVLTISLPPNTVLPLRGGSSLAFGDRYLHIPGLRCGQSDLRKLLPCSHGPNGDFPGLGHSHPVGGGMAGKPKHRTMNGHRIEDSGDLKSPWQGTEVKCGPCDRKV